MKNRSTKHIFSELNKLSQSDAGKRKLSFKFQSELLNYQPHLKNFSLQHYQLFDELASTLDLQGSIKDLFDGEIINKTENKQALHHQYRLNQKEPQFNFKFWKIFVCDFSKKYYTHLPFYNFYSGCISYS